MNRYFLIGVLASLSVGCGGMTTSSDGIPYHRLQAYKVTVTTEYVQAKKPLYAPSHTGYCYNSVREDIAMLPSKSTDYIKVKAPLFGAGSGKIEFAPAGNLKSISLDIDNSGATDAAAKVAAAALPTLGLLGTLNAVDSIAGTVADLPTDLISTVAGQVLSKTALQQFNKGKYDPSTSEQATIDYRLDTHYLSAAQLREKYCRIGDVRVTTVPL